jgi:hypothetical protein
VSTLHEFALRRADGADALDALASAIDGAGLSAGSTAAELRALAARARSGRFHVLLVGCFSTGKSTLLNAIVGEPVLPVKVNPSTAILTELVHGEQPAVEVRYRDGSTRDLDLPSFLAEFQLRDTASDPFGNVDRAVLSVPLPLLKDGVVVVDSPGLDDDEIRTARTLSSLPEADAVIVVLNASRFLTELERRILRRELLPRGLTNLFFPVTMVDLLASIADDPEAERKAMVERARQALGPLCTIDGEDRFEERFFLLDARGGLAARWDRTAGQRRPPDPAALEATGLPAFERSLEAFLVRERGRAQMGQLLSAAKRARADLQRRADLDRATANASVEELKRRQEELAPQFERLQAIAKRVAKTVDGFVARQQVAVWQDLRDFLVKTEEALPEAIAGFDLGNMAGLDLLAPRGRQRIEAKLREQLEAWLGQRVATWQEGSRDRLERALSDLRVELAAHGGDFDDVVRGIVTDFAGGVVNVPGAAQEEQEIPAAERWLSMAMGAVLLSPGAMAAGWSEGWDGAIKGAAGRLGVRVALFAVGALLGPIGWAGLLLYVVSDAVLLVLTGGGQLRRVRDQVAGALKGKLVAQAEEARPQVAARVAEALQPLRDGIVAAAEAEAAQLAEQLDRTIAAREAAVRDAKGREEAWTALLQRADAAVGKVEALL